MLDQALIYGKFHHAPALLRYWKGQMLHKPLRRPIEKCLVRYGDSVYVRA